MAKAQGAEVALRTLLLQAAVLMGVAHLRGPMPDEVSMVTQSGPPASGSSGPNILESAELPVPAVPVVEGEKSETQLALDIAVTNMAGTSSEAVLASALAHAPSYKLSFQADGRSFFDGFNFIAEDGNHGAAALVSSFAEAGKVAEAHATHAILRAGVTSAAHPHKRTSAKVATKRSWKYFLAAMKYTHLPYGCGVWPSFFTLGANAPWPAGGEMDILEWVNDQPSITSFHTSQSCTLDPDQVNKFKPMPDANLRMNGDRAYDCQTQYCAGCTSLGCAPNSMLLTGEQWATRPGVIAMERTSSFAKIFFLPEGVWNEDPHPEAWSEHLIAYYPFKDSRGCMNAEDVMGPQQLVLSLNFCGDWASKVWGASTCSSMGLVPQDKCRSVDPLAEYAPREDCCTQFIWDEDGKFGSAGYLHERAYFNISWLKVFT